MNNLDVGDQLVQRNRRKAKRTCFISASSTSEIQVIRSLLLARQIKPVSAGDLLGEGFVIDELQDAIRMADIVVAVLDPTEKNANVFYEIGYAHALGKRVVVFLPPKAESVPLDMSHFAVVRAKSDNAEAVDFALSQALVAPKSHKRKREKAPSESKPIGHYADELLRRFEGMADSPSESPLVDLVVAAIQASGISVLRESSRSEVGADIAIWSDELERWVGNPFLIEVKRHLSDPRAVDIMWSRLRRSMWERRPRFMLLLFADGDPDPIDSERHEPILLLHIRQLLSDLKTRSFADVVRALRNQRVHRGTE